MVNIVVIIFLLVSSTFAGLPETEYVKMELTKLKHAQKVRKDNYLTLFGDATAGSWRNIEYNGYWSGMLGVDWNITNWMQRGEPENISHELKRIRLEYVLDSLRSEEVIRKKSLIQNLKFAENNPISIPRDICEDGKTMPDDFTHYDAAMNCHKMNLMLLDYSHRLELMNDTLVMLRDVSVERIAVEKSLSDRLDTYLDTSSTVEGPSLINFGIRTGKVFGLNGPLHEDFFVSLYFSMPISRLVGPSHYREYNKAMRYEIKQARIESNNTRGMRGLNQEITIHVRSLKYAKKQINIQSKLIEALKFRLDNGLENEPAKLFRANLDYITIICKEHLINFRLNYLNNFVEENDEYRF